MALRGADDKDGPEDYLPLPISEEYQLPSKGRRRSAQGQQSRPSQPGSVSKPEMSHSTAALRAPQRELRRFSDSSDREALEQSLPGAEGGELEGDVGQIFQRGKSDTSTYSILQQDAADEEAAELRPLGPVFPRKHKPGKPKGHSEQTGSHQQRGKAQPPVSAYDFAAARAEAKGLDVSSIIGLPAKRKASHKSLSARSGRSSARAEKDGAGEKLSASWPVPSCLPDEASPDMPKKYSRREVER